MNRVIKYGILALLLTLKVKAQEHSLIYSVGNDAGFYLNRFNTMIANPINLQHWDMGEWHNVNCKTFLEEGDYRSVSAPRQKYGLDVKAGSFSTFFKSRLLLFGEFNYEYSIAKKTSWNLEYQAENKNGSPYYFASKAPGDWTFQRYGFNFDVVYQLVPGQWTAAIEMKYDGLLQFRNQDTRIDKTTVPIETKAMLAYTSGNNTITAGYKFSRTKSESLKSIKYDHHKSEPDLYWPYFFKGLGNYSSSEPFTSQNFIFIHEPQLGFQAKTQNGLIQAIYKIGFIDDQIKKKFTTTGSDLSESIGSYKAVNHSMQLAKFVNGKTKASDQILDIDFLSGSAFEPLYNFDNYIYTHLNISAGQNVLYPGKTLEEYGLNLSYRYQHQHEKMFNQTVDYGTLTAKAYTRIQTPALKRSLDLILGIEGKTNINSKFSPGAAEDNLYNIEVLYHNYQYHSASHLMFKPAMEFSQNLGSSILSIALNHNLTKAFFQGTEYNGNTMPKKTYNTTQLTIKVTY